MTDQPRPKGKGGRGVHLTRAHQYFAQTCRIDYLMIWDYELNDSDQFPAVIEQIKKFIARGREEQKARASAPLAVQTSVLPSYATSGPREHCKRRSRESER